MSPEHYGALKALCEKAAQAAMPGRVAVVRPGLIVGQGDPTDRFTYWPARVARGGEVLAPGDGEDPIQFIDVRDLAASSVGLVERRTVGTFNALARPTPSPCERCWRRARRPTAETPPSPGWTGWLVEQQKVSALDGHARVDSARERGQGHGQISNARALAQGLTFRPAVDTARDTLAWFKTLPPERQAKLRAGLTPEREREVLAAWHQRG